MKRLEKRKRDFRRDPSLERLFIAIQPPLELRRELSKNNNIFSKEMRNFKFIDQDQLHLTLKYLGSEVSQDSKKKIIDLLSFIAPQIYSPTVKIKDLQYGFPRQMIPTLLYYNIEANKSMQEVTSIIHDQIMELDLPDVKREKDYKKIVYHLTIGRAKHNSNKAYGRKIRGLIKENSQDIDKEFIAETMYLLKSTLTKGVHPKYEIIGQFKFKSAPAIRENG